MRIPSPPVTGNPQFDRWAADIGRILETYIQIVSDQVQQKGVAVSVAVHTVANLPSATAALLPAPPNSPTGQSGVSKLIMVSDEASGATLAFSDGADWRRVQDLAVVT